MSFDDPDFRAAFFALHSDLPREAPGGEAETLRALVLAAPPGDARIADMGCGPGAAAVPILRALPGAHVTALDLHPPFVAAARARAEAAGVADRLDARAEDMAGAGLPDGGFDLIWCEGALYFLGVEAGLRGWRRLLRPGGRVAFTDAVWLVDDRPAQAAEMWRAYPAMTDLPGMHAAVAAAGFRVRDGFVLPEGCWDAYLDPLAARADALDAELSRTAGGRAALAETREEVAVWQACRGAYGYAFVIAEAA